jgi:hypothetical protein
MLWYILLLFGPFGIVWCLLVNFSVLVFLTIKILATLSPSSAWVTTESMDAFDSFSNSLQKIEENVKLTKD